MILLYKFSCRILNKKLECKIFAKYKDSRTGIEIIVNTAGHSRIQSFVLRDGEDILNGKAQPCFDKLIEIVSDTHVIHFKEGGILNVEIGEVLCVGKLRVDNLLRNIVVKSGLIVNS